MYTTPPPSGGVVLAHILKILQGYNMGHDDGKTISRRVINLHRLAEAFKHSFAKRTQLGDPTYANITQVSFVSPVFISLLQFRSHSSSDALNVHTKV